MGTRCKQALHNALHHAKSKSSLSPLSLTFSADNLNKSPFLKLIVSFSRALSALGRKQKKKVIGFLLSPFTTKAKRAVSSLLKSLSLKETHFSISCNNPSFVVFCSFLALLYYVNPTKPNCAQLLFLLLLPVKVWIFLVIC